MKLKVVLILLGLGIVGIGIALAVSLSLPWWASSSIGGASGLFLSLGLVRQGKKPADSPSPPPPGVLQQLPGLAQPMPPGGIQLGTNIVHAFGPGPMQAAAAYAAAHMLAEAETAFPEPEGEPPTVLGLTGWRVLKVASMRPLVLVGTAGGHVIGRYAEPAICDQGEEHEVPAWSCSGKAAGCGYYILNDPPPDGSSGTVLAKVSPAGRTIRCELGYRTHRYRLEELWLPRHIARDTNIEEAEERFGVPVYVLERMLPDGDRAKEGRDHLRTSGDAQPAPAQEGAEAGAGEGS